MIMNFLSTQSVGSKPVESPQRPDAYRKSGDSFESAMKRSANEPNQNSRDVRRSRDSDPSQRKATDTVEGQAPDNEPGNETDTAAAPRQSAAKDADTDGPSAEDITALDGVSPASVVTPEETDTNVFADQLGKLAEEGAEQQPVLPQNPEAAAEGAEESAAVSLANPPADRVAPDATGKQMSAKTGQEPGSPAAAQAVPSGDQSGDQQEQSGVIKTAEAEASDTEDASLPTSRTGVLEDQNGRNRISTTLEAHREILRQQRPLASATAAAEPAKTAAATPVATTAEGEDAAIRLPGLPPASTAQQPVAAPAIAAAQARPDRSDASAQTPALTQASGAAFDVRTQSMNVQVKPAQTAGASASGAATQSAATGTVLQSTSAVVTSVFGTSDSAMTGEDVLTQRGAESFALPQLLAEASVRSGASSFRAETPRHVAQQLAEAVATNGKRNIDVSLNPRELGHVNMRVSTSETGVMVVIQAERQETEDLMRRHIQDLAREFKEMGFSDISFQFGSDTEAGQSGDGELADESGGAGLKGEGDAAEGEPQGLPLSQQLNISANGLDIRI
mgnify:CR=1 FL=1